jgi:CDP-diacylglycerol--serine O-phosphatidyltransferase
LLPGPVTRERRLKFVAVNVCTSGNLLLGALAVWLTLSGELSWAAACILGCVGFDGLDGALARRFGVATPFGAELDSLADMCAFGLATPFVVYHWLGMQFPAYVVGPACAAILLCAAIRLARFNVTAKDGHYFTGVPTTMAAAVLAFCVLIRPGPVVSWVLVAALGLLMVSPLPYPKVRQLLRLPPWVWVAPLPAALVSRTLAFALVVGAYLSSGPLLWVRRRRAA